MSEDTENEKKLESPIFQFFLEFIAYFFLAGLAFLIGLGASIYLEDFSHLGRAGAVITLIAISMAYKDFYMDLKNMSFDEAVKFAGKEKLFEIWASSFVHKKKDELETIRPGFNEADALKFLDELEELSEEKLDKDGFIKSWLLEMFSIWSKALRRWEFNMLKVGTVLWAFSDLLNIPFGWGV